MSLNGTLKHAESAVVYFNYPRRVRLVLAELFRLIDNSVSIDCTVTVVSFVARSRGLRAAYFPPQFAVRRASEVMAKVIA